MSLVGGPSLSASADAVQGPCAPACEGFLPYRPPTRKFTASLFPPAAAPRTSSGNSLRKMSPLLVCMMAPRGSSTAASEGGRDRQWPGVEEVA